MPNRSAANGSNRELLLADVAVMYYLDKMSQSEIGKIIGVTPSMVSRLLTEARDKNLVEITVHSPLITNRELEKKIQEKYSVQKVRIVSVRNYEMPWLRYIGNLGARVLEEELSDGMVVGFSWGATLKAVAEALADIPLQKVRIAELSGALGSNSADYQGHELTLTLSKKLNAEYFLLNAPFLCSDSSVCASLLENEVVSRPLSLAKQASVGVSGIGSLDLLRGTMARFGYLSEQTVKDLRSIDTVGNVCGLFFDKHGNPVNSEICKRIITIDYDSWFKIPTRIGIAGGPDKVEPIKSAMLGGYITNLVTDSCTAELILNSE